MSCCAVATCKNNSRKTKKLGVRVIYHKFPKDPETHKIWVSKTKRLDKVNWKYGYICSDHFQPDDYEDDLKNRLLGLPEKKILKSFAVPSLNLPIQATQNNQSIPRKPLNKRRACLNALDRSEDLNPEKLDQKITEPIACNTSEKLVDDSHAEEKNCSSCAMLIQENNFLRECIINLNKKISSLENERHKNLRELAKKNNTRANFCKKIRVPSTWRIRRSVGEKIMVRNHMKVIEKKSA